MMTNLNYLWPVTAGLASFLLYRYYQERKVNKLYISSSILLLFATSQEQVVVVFLSVWAYEWWRKKRSTATWSPLKIVLSFLLL